MPGVQLTHFTSNLKQLNRGDAVNYAQFMNVDVELRELT